MIAWIIAFLSYYHLTCDAVRFYKLVKRIKNDPDLSARICRVINTIQKDVINY